MSWETVQIEQVQIEQVQIEQVQVGDLLRYPTVQEFVVARIDRPFLGRDDIVCLVEDTPERWHAYPIPLASTVQRRAAR